MLDGLLGRSGFSSKCKSLIKPTRTRIEVLRRRAEAKQRFLKEDLAKLLANGLDVNAYGRTEEFIAGLNTLSCYTFIDQSCEYILKHLSIMQKLGHCPEECRETVASLMFAAARFSDLPELRDLRDVFQERYGNGLECFVNQVFVEKIASEPPVVEKRIKLLQDIAAEFSIQWDSKGFKQRMDKPSAVAQDQAQKPGSLSATDDKYKQPNGNNIFRKNNQRSKERIEHAQDRPPLHNDGNVNIRKKEVLGFPFVKREEKRFKERIEQTHEGPVLQNDGNVNVRRNEELNIPYVRREEKCSKERIEHAHEGLMLQERNGNGNGSVRMREVLDIPFVGRDEKFGYKHEDCISKLETGGYISKPRQENDSENNGFGKYDTPVMMKTSGGSYHDRQAEVFNDDRANRERKERHGYKQEPATSRPETNANGDTDDRANRERKERHGYKQEPVTSRPETNPNGDTDDHLVRGRHEMKTSRRSRDRRPENLDNDHVTAFLNGDHDDHLVRGRHEMKTSRRSRDRRPENLDNDHVTAFLNGDHDDHLVRERHEMKTSRRSRDRRPENLDNDHVTAFLNREKPDLLHPGKSEGISNGTKHLVNGDEEDVLKLTGKVKEEEAIRLKSSLPPPYVKLNIPPPYSKPNNVSKPERIKDESDRLIGEDHHYHNDILLPKPRSIRRKHSKSASSPDDIGSSEDARTVRRISSSRRKERKGLQIVFDDEHYHSPKDEEEKMMDKLLLHYSKKPSAYDIGKLRKKNSRSNTSKSPSPHHGRNGEVAEMIVPPMRSLSLPNEHSGESEPKKVYARANSFQPDNQAPHVHPKLPDYDDLAARFAAMRGR